MAFESLFSSPPNPALDPTPPGRPAGEDEREDGELEDGEIDDAGFEEEQEPETKEVKEVKEVEIQKTEKTHRKSRKKHKKEKEKKKTKRKRREKHKHNSPSSGNSSDSDVEHSERSHKKVASLYRDYDTPFTQHGPISGNYMNSPKVQHCKKMKTKEYDEYSNYSDEKLGNFFEEEDEDFADQLNQYRQAKETSNAVPGPPCTNQPMKQPFMKGVQQDIDQQCSNFGVGRGRGIQKKQKRKERGRGRGNSRGPNSFSGADGYHEDGKRKKWVGMSQEFINQHTVEHKGKQICKYFLEGRCIKGDQCKFDHDAEVGKRKEACKFYIQGYCSKGDNCLFMHHEFPCKFYHTGAKCYQGDNCKFSHAPLTEETSEMLDKVFNNEEEPQNEDQIELVELRRRGIAPLPKPPPGRGLLPTPQELFSFSEADDELGHSVKQKKIPSMYDAGTSVDGKHMIGQRPTLYNSTSPPGPQFLGSNASPQHMYSPEESTGSSSNLSHGPNGSTLHPSSPNHHPRIGPQGFPIPKNPHLHTISSGFAAPQNQSGGPIKSGPLSPPGIGGAYNIHGVKGHIRHIPREDRYPLSPNYPQNSSEKQHSMQQDSVFESVHNPTDVYDNYYSHQAIHNFQSNNNSDGPWHEHFADNPPHDVSHESHNSGSESDCISTPSQKSTIAVPDFLPAMQKALFVRLSQKQQNDGTPNRSQPQRSLSKDEDDTVNWYSSSEEEEGSGVKSILKTLKKQTEILKQQQLSVEQRLVAPTDPRLAKDRNVGSHAVDPRVRSPIRPSVGKPSESGCSDPRVVRDPRNVKVHDTGHTASSISGVKSNMHHPRTGIKIKKKAIEDDEDTERELREKPVVIPLESLPGVTLRDPRSKLRQFSHIKMDIILTKPNFAKVIVWAPEDLLPIPLPKPDPVSSINLPLPPLIADQRLNKARHLVSDALQIAMPVDPRLVIKTKNASITSRATHVDQSSDFPTPVNKLSDPRLKKHVDPRLHRLSSSETYPGILKDSLPPKFLPRIVRAETAPSQTLSALASKSDQDALPPYAPKLSSAGVRTGTPSSILRSISLYDPRDHSSSPLDSPQVSYRENGEHQKKTGILKNAIKSETEYSEDSFQQKCTVEASLQPKAPQNLEKSADMSTDAQADKLNSLNNCEPKLDTAHSSTAPAVHNLPIQALTGLIRPQYSDSRQVKQSGQANQVQDVDSTGESDDKPLKDVFKTFDPTASPFC